MKKRRSLWIALAVGATLLVIGGLFLWRQSATRSTAEVRTAVVERDTLRVLVTASGQIEPAAQVTLSFDVPGRVAEVAVDPGDAVRAGQVLARLNTTDLERALTQAELNLRAARLRLEQIRKPPDEDRIRHSQHAVDQAAAALEVAQLNLSTVLSGTLLNEDLENARYRLQDAESQYARSLQEYQAGRISDAMMNRVTQAYVAAQRYLERIQQQGQLQLETAQNEVTRARQAYQEATDALERLQRGPDPQDIEAAQLEVDLAQLSLDKARSDLEKATLVAPFDGLVAAVQITAGQMASTGMPAVTLVDPSRYRLTVYVDEMDVAKLAAGLPVEVGIDALPDQAVSGVVERIGPAATTNQGAVSYPVVIALSPSDLPLRAGMSATASIVVRDLTDQLLVPNWIVRVDEATGQTYVHRQTAAGVERVDVRLGIRYEGYSQVLSGLNEGDVLVLVRDQTNRFFAWP